MPYYRYRLYQHPATATATARKVDELIIDAADDGDAIAQAKAVRAPFEFEADFVVLYGPAEQVLWQRDAPDGWAP
jgi:hypothetical protein